MIYFKDVRFSYQDKKDVQLCIQHLVIKKGECVLLTGISGCGKSTITKFINGLIPEFFEGDFSGEVCANDCNFNTMRVYEISRITGSVFQDPSSQFFTENVLSELAFACENYGIPPAEIKLRIENSVNTLHIKNLAEKRLTALSNGEKQKIAIASVLTMQPAIILLDEPSSNLDYASILILRGIIKTLKEKGFTIIIAEHRIYYLHDIFDRVLYVKDGKISKEYLTKEFQQLTNVELHNKGLRSLDIFLNKPVRTSAAPQKITLSFNGIGFAYKNKSVFSNLNGQLYSGEICALVGKNGAGKTTLARVIAGIYKQCAGTIAINGKKLHAAQRISAVNFVMNDIDYQLFGDTVHNELMIGNTHIDDLENKITAVLKRLNLYELKDEHPFLLSMGQKQRLVIAASYIRNSALTILDEPTSGLDYRNMLAVSSMLGELSREQNAVLIISHDYEFIANTCDRLLLLTKSGIEKDIRLHGKAAALKEIFINDLGMVH